MTFCDFPTNAKSIIYYNNIKLSSVGVCQLKSEQGYSGQYVVKWFYDAEKQMCDPFLYEGEGGNGNRFDTQEECKKACDNDHLHSAG